MLRLKTHEHSYNVLISSPKLKTSIEARSFSALEYRDISAFSAATEYLAEHEIPFFRNRPTFLDAIATCINSQKTSESNEVVFGHWLIIVNMTLTNEETGDYMIKAMYYSQTLFKHVWLSAVLKGDVHRQMISS